MDIIAKGIWKIIDFCLEKIFKPLLEFFYADFSEKQWESIKQFIKFGLVGASNTMISYLIYVIGVALGMTYLLANFVGFLISVLNSFYWNNKFVFTKGSEGRSALATLIKTFIAYGVTGIVLASVLLYLWVDVAGISEYIAPIINLFITIPLNYIINKYWAFQSR